MDYVVHAEGEVYAPKLGRFLKKHKGSSGYVHVTMHRKPKLLHRLVAEAFLPNPENHPVVNHKDGNKDNNQASNLEWCTQSYNVQHAYDTGLALAAAGEQHGMAKLTWEQVDWIREVYVPYSNEFGGKALGEKLGIDKSIISDIVNNKIWRRRGL